MPTKGMKNYTMEINVGTEDDPHWVNYETKITFANKFIQWLFLKLEKINAKLYNRKERV